MHEKEAAVAEESIQDAQEDLVGAFQFFEDWMDRYQYIIDMGRELPPFPEAERTEENRVHGCQSQVWLTVEELDDGRLRFRATSDAAIVQGLIAMLLRIYSDRTPREIADTPPDFIREIGLDQHLSPSRSNGLNAMILRMKDEARKRLQGG